jgi:hypothetical protein
MPQGADMPPHPPLARIAAWPRDKRFWALIATLAVGQLVAFWMLCNYQVRQAQARGATVQVERMAVAACLRYGPGAIPDHCAARLATRHEPGALRAASENTAHISAASYTWMSSAMPVSFLR